MEEHLQMKRKHKLLRKYSRKWYQQNQKMKNHNRRMRIKVNTQKSKGWVTTTSNMNLLIDATQKV
jgi:hypothetical protein